MPVHGSAVALVVVSGVARHVCCHGCRWYTLVLAVLGQGPPVPVPVLRSGCGATLDNGSSEYGSNRRGQGAGGLASRRWDDRLRLQIMAARRNAIMLSGRSSQVRTALFIRRRHFVLKGGTLSFFFHHFPGRLPIGSVYWGMAYVPWGFRSLV